MSDSYTRTGNDVANYVKRQFGDESGVQITNTDILQWLNIAQMDLAQENEFSKKIGTTSVVSEQQEYLFPDYDILYVQTLYVNNKLIKFLTFQEFQEYIQKQEGYDTAKQPTPKVWTEWGGTITLWPRPSDNIEEGLRLFFIAKPKDLATLSDNLSVPDKLFAVILKMVMVHAYQLDEQFDAANLQRQVVDNDIGKLSHTPNSTASNEYPCMTILEEDEYGW